MLQLDIGTCVHEAAQQAAARRETEAAAVLVASEAATARAVQGHCIAARATAKARQAAVDRKVEKFKGKVVSRQTIEPATHEGAHETGAEPTATVTARMAQEREVANGEVREDSESAQAAVLEIEARVEAASSGREASQESTPAVMAPEELVLGEEAASKERRGAVAAHGAVLAFEAAEREAAACVAAATRQEADARMAARCASALAHETAAARMAEEREAAERIARAREAAARVVAEGEAAKRLAMQREAEKRAEIEAGLAAERAAADRAAADRAAADRAAAQHAAGGHAISESAAAGGAAAEKVSGMAVKRAAVQREETEFYAGTGGVAVRESWVKVAAARAEAMPAARRAATEGQEMAKRPAGVPGETIVPLKPGDVKELYEFDGNFYRAGPRLLNSVLARMNPSGRLVQVRGTGDCFYLSVWELVKERFPDKSWKALKTMAVEFLARHKPDLEKELIARFAVFADDLEWYERLVFSFLNDGVFAEETEINTIALMLGRDICIWSITKAAVDATIVCAPQVVWSTPIQSILPQDVRQPLHVGFRADRCTFVYNSCGLPLMDGEKAVKAEGHYWAIAWNYTSPDLSTVRVEDEFEDSNGDCDGWTMVGQEWQAAQSINTMVTVEQWRRLEEMRLSGDLTRNLCPPACDNPEAVDVVLSHIARREVEPNASQWRVDSHHLRLGLAKELLDGLGLPGPSDQLRVDRVQIWKSCPEAHCGENEATVHFRLPAGKDRDALLLGTRSLLRRPDLSLHLSRQPADMVVLLDPADAKKLLALVSALRFPLGLAERFVAACFEHSFGLGFAQVSLNATPNPRVSILAAPADVVKLIFPSASERRLQVGPVPILLSKPWLPEKRIRELPHTMLDHGPAPEGCCVMIGPLSKNWMACSNYPSRTKSACESFVQAVQKEWKDHGSPRLAGATLNILSNHLATKDGETGTAHGPYGLVVVFKSCEDAKNGLVTLQRKLPGRILTGAWYPNLTCCRHVSGSPDLCRLASFKFIQEMSHRNRGAEAGRQ